MISKRGHGGVLGNLFEARGARATKSLVLRVIDNYEAIQQALKWMGTPPGPDGALFRHRKVIELADNPGFNAPSVDDAESVSRPTTEV